MELARDIYRAFEDVVGTENISMDPAVQEGYAFQPMGGAGQGKRFFLRPPAVILPGSAKEVQAIVKLCSRFGMKVKPHGTGYGAHAGVGSENTVQLDLRRMNRIIDIDKKNMIVVVEPYVSFIQVMGEVMRLGLSCNVLGAGCQASMLASYTSMHGNNVLAVSQGYSGRNLLGVEWVLPTGEIARLGAPGSAAGWFSGDGPGPSLRGIMRGGQGAMGGLGVFTKCAAHLHPWYGPAELEIKGVSPYYEAALPPNFEYHICDFPSWEAFGEGMSKVGAAGLAFGLQKTGGPGSVGNCITGNNNEFYAMKMEGKLNTPWMSFCIVMAASCPEEHDWQVKTLDKILAETGGRIHEIGEDPMWKNRDFLTMIKSCFIPRLAFRPSGTFGVDGMIGMDTADQMALGLIDDEAHFKKWTKTGIIMDNGDLNNWAVTYEGSHFALMECGWQFSSIDMDSILGYQKMTAEGFDICFKKPYCLSWNVSGAEKLKRAGPVCMNFPRWMRAVKRAFDPEEVSDPTIYTTVEEK
jgi:glycolate oxidase